MNPSPPSMSRRGSSEFPVPNPASRRRLDAPVSSECAQRAGQLGGLLLSKVLNPGGMAPIANHMQKFFKFPDLMSLGLVNRNSRNDVEALALHWVPSVKQALQTLEMGLNGDLDHALDGSQFKHLARLIDTDHLRNLLASPDVASQRRACQLLRPGHFSSNPDIQHLLLAAARHDDPTLSHAAISAVFQLPVNHPLRSNLLTALTVNGNHDRMSTVLSHLDHELIRRPQSLATLVQLIADGFVPVDLSQRVHDMLINYLQFGVRHAPFDQSESASLAHANNLALLIQRVQDQDFPILFRCEIFAALMSAQSDNPLVHELVANLLSQLGPNVNLLDIANDLNALQAHALEFAPDLSYAGVNLLCTRLPQLLDHALAWIRSPLHQDTLEFKSLGFHILDAQSRENHPQAIGFVREAVGLYTLDNLRQAVNQALEAQEFNRASQLRSLGKQIISVLINASDHAPEFWTRLAHVAYAPDFPLEWRTPAFSALIVRSSDHDVPRRFLTDFANHAPLDGNILLHETDCLHLAPAPLQQRGAAYFLAQLRAENSPWEMRPTLLQKLFNVLPDLQSKAPVLLERIASNQEHPQLRQYAADLLLGELDDVAPENQEEVCKAWIQDISRRANQGGAVYTDYLKATTIGPLRCWDLELVEALGPTQPIERRIRLLELIATSSAPVPQVFFNKCREFTLNEGENQAVKELAWRVVLAGTTSLAGKVDLWARAGEFKRLAFADMDRELGKLIYR